METVGKNKTALGCEICKPAVANILASLYNEHVMKVEHHHLQDTNDRFMANIQRNGTFSVVPRMPAGEVTPDGLIAVGRVAKKYGLYTKITGGQRVDMWASSPSLGLLSLLTASTGSVLEGKICPTSGVSRF